MTFKHILYLILVLSLFLETTLFSFPLVVVTALLLYIFFPKTETLFMVFMIGLLLDALKVSQFGITPLFLMGVFLLLNFYKRYFEPKDLLFVTPFVFLCAFIYALLVSYAVSITFYSLLFVQALMVVLYARSKGYRYE